MKDICYTPANTEIRYVKTHKRELGRIMHFKCTVCNPINIIYKRTDVGIEKVMGCFFFCSLRVYMASARWFANLKF